ncbi:MAG: LysR family transcriptional regulator [Rhodobacteraceae bacterium]|nr:LysR family transcriptional regulator [Paracoccaceae bacterium]
MHRGIKLRHIRAFLDIAKEGSLSAVAREQGITQPALSRTLSELEDLLGVALFRRENRRLVLTEHGAIFRRHASQGLQAFETGAAALRPDYAGGAVRVGILPSAATDLFPRLALKLRNLSPETLLKIETGPHKHLVGLLRDGRIDLMFGRMPDASDMSGLAFEHLYEEDIVLVARNGHPQFGAHPTEFLQQSPVILPPEDAIIRRPVNDYLSTLNLFGLRPAFETVALAIGLWIVTSSDSVWFISRGVVSDEIKRGRLVEIPTDVRFLSGAVGMTYRHGARMSQSLDLLMRLTRDEAMLHGNSAEPHRGAE